ncbi:FAD-dependent oxidoreductase [Leisingera sp. M527]|uniref:flavin monoamine oxidase family protein n=1 Tax=unclassified Leisingera TaxID=2614906 RepID=UPI0021A2CD4D|nr:MULTISPECIES: FAD-dependent oxidoreductase [unclassified Leisingera]UWQ32071.1 FAD-dependent oxidoreductase [Leisingera sp. M527]UWQ79700.1 FAD-dependent oxidoreductase [Leisingera sp. S132]
MQTDILIVGGGLSGLALADHLTRKGADFLLVEAQDRLGGRILTKELSGGKFDLGPAWFWPGQPRMAALARRFDIPVFPQYSTGDQMYQDRSGAVQRARGFASMEGSYRLAGGMGALISALAGSLDAGRILTQARLETVQHSPGSITAHLDQNGASLTVKAKKIMLAIPPRVIADTVSFEPALDEAQSRSLKNVPTWMAGQAKILAVYDQPHWRNAGLSGDAMSHRGPMAEIHDASAMEGGPYALFGFVGVSAEARAAQRDDMMDQALAQLTAMFGPKMAHPLDLVLQDWAAVPEIARAQDRVPSGYHPSYGLPSSLRSLAAHGMHFCSTETARGFGGFLEGALEAAEQTAKTAVLSMEADG